MKRILVSIGLLLLVVMLPMTVFAGGEPEASQTVAGSAAATGGEITLKVAFPTGGEMPEKAINAAFDAYSKMHPNVKFETLTAPMVDFENVVLKTILSKGDIPDLYYLTGGSWQLRKYIEAGDFAVDLTP